MGRVGAAEFEFGELGSVVESVLARRQHVAKAARVIGAVGFDLYRGGGTRANRAGTGCGHEHRGRDQHPHVAQTQARNRCPILPAAPSAARSRRTIPAGSPSGQYEELATQPQGSMRAAVVSARPLPT